MLAELNRLYAHRSAVHEAGHALAIWYQGRCDFVPDNWPIGEVAIRHDPDKPFVIEGRDFEADGVKRGGFTSRKTLLWRDEAYRAPPSWSLPDREWTRRELDYMNRVTLQRRMAEVTCVYAGPLAEARYHDDYDLSDESAWFDYLDNQGETDNNTDCQHIVHAGTKLGRRWRLHMARAWARAERIVRAHPGHIEVLAATLITRGLIDGQEVFDIFDAAGPPVI
jgi:hypothetical protein